MLQIAWRPSGGRGEYEYLSDADLLDKRLTIRVPLLNVDIATDVHFRHVDGKPRLRRESPSDRTQLNAHALIAAISALPKPQRADTNPLKFPLEKDTFVLSSVHCEIVSQDAKTVLVLPQSLRILHAQDDLDISARIQVIIDASKASAAARDFLEQLKSGINTSALSKLAGDLHATFPYDPKVAPTATPSPAPAAAPPETDDFIADYKGKEGAEKIRTHRMKERDSKVVAHAKAQFRKRYGKLLCECCGICIEESYAPVGKDFIEAHHKVPLSSVDGVQETKIENYAMLCPNCHRMIHRLDTCSIDELRGLLEKNGFAVFASNLALLKAS